LSDKTEKHGDKIILTSMEEFEENKKRMIFVITGDIYIGLKNFTLDLLALHVQLKSQSSRYKIVTYETDLLALTRLSRLGY
jgi:hypothetical protein